MVNTLMSSQSWYSPGAFHVRRSPASSHALHTVEGVLLLRFGNGSSQRPQVRLLLCSFEPKSDSSKEPEKVSQAPPVYNQEHGHGFGGLNG
jgi:hypothetical protein